MAKNRRGTRKGGAVEPASEGEPQASSARVGFTFHPCTSGSRINRVAQDLVEAGHMDPGQLPKVKPGGTVEISAARDMPGFVGRLRPLGFFKPEPRRGRVNTGDRSRRTSVA